MEVVEKFGSGVARDLNASFPSPSAHNRWERSLMLPSRALQSTCFDSRLAIKPSKLRVFKSCSANLGFRVAKLY